MAYAKSWIPGNKGATGNRDIPVIIKLAVYDKPEKRPREDATCRTLHCLVRKIIDERGLTYTKAPGYVVGQELTRPVTYFQNKIRAWMHNDMPKDNFTGKWCTWHNNGRMSTKTSYKNGKRHGTRCRWTSKGILILKEHYRNGVRTKCTRYDPTYPDGIVRFRERLTEDTLSWSRFFPSGDIAETGELQNGQGWRHRFHANGKLASIGKFTQGLKTGLWKAYHESGTLKSAGLYEAGRKEGIWHFFHQSGYLGEFGPFHRGKQSGLWYYWYPNGSISAYGGYRKGQCWQYWVTFWSNCEKHSEGMYNEHGLNGPWYVYNSEGELHRLMYYKNDVLVGVK
ncbi:hypothetical protein KDA11_00080 [Candidatus Saccharibacteria bacterium]|nr:hypothetical protein [Candidatus Saccharibacteria bacterium]